MHELHVIVIWVVDSHTVPFTQSLHKQMHELHGLKDKCLILCTQHTQRTRSDIKGQAAGVASHPAWLKMADIAKMTPLKSLHAAGTPPAHSSLNLISAVTPR